MINFLRANKNLSLAFFPSILFFLNKGIQYFLIGSYTPLLIIISIIVLLAISMKTGKKVFFVIIRIWAITLVVWSAVRILISVIHITIKPFEGSFHLANQFSSHSLVLSIVMLALGILMFRSSNKKRIKDSL